MESHPGHGSSADRPGCSPAEAGSLPAPYGSWLPYAVAFLGVAGAMLLRWPFQRILGQELAFLFLWPAVMLAGWLGGLGPGLFATLLSALAASFFLLEPRHSFLISRPADLVGLVVFVGCCGAISALAERFHRAKRQAERQREHWRVTLASIGDAVIATDAGGRVAFLNRVAESLTGWTQADARGRALGEVFHLLNEDTRRPAENPVEKVLRTGHVAGMANRTLLVSKSGQEYAISDSAAPIRGGHSEVCGVIVVFRDVTSQRQAEKAQEATRERLVNIVESIGDGFVAIDRQWRYSYVNRHALQLLHKTRHEMEGRVLWEVFPEVVGTPFEAALRRAMQEGTATHLEAFYPPLGGWYEAHHYPSADGLCVFFTDITARKQAEEQVQEQARLLREADAAKDRFLGTLAHELRGPLSPLRNSIPVLRLKSGSDPHLQQVTDLIERQVLHLTRLVEDLVDVSRAGSGKIVLQREQVDLQGLVARAVEMCRPLLDAKSQELVVSLPAEPVLLQADPTRLTQVLHNLLVNAGKFTGPNGQIRLSGTREDRWVVVRLRDNGIGISADLLPRIFDWLKQGPALVPAESGLGIGLSLVKSLVDLHEGSIEAHSDGAGQGSEFVVRLPALPVP